MSIYESVLITGANRGIGLQLVKEFLKLGNSKVAKVLASYRDPNSAKELNELSKSHSNLSLLQLDTKNYAGYDKFRDQVAAIVGDKGLSLLINNAGILLRTSLEDVTPEKMIENFEVNAVTPLMLSKALLPLLQKSSAAGHRTVIAQMSSLVGSIADNKLGNYYSYRASKSALNQVGKSMSVDLKKDSISVVLLHPGWVKTDMGGEKAPLTVEQSASQMTNVLIDQSRDLNGKFLNYDGAELPW